MARSNKSDLNAEEHIRELVNTINESYLDQLAASDYRVGNKHARKGLAAFKALCKYGSTGRDVLAAHLKDKRPAIRLHTAVALLGYRHNECMQVLKALAVGNGMIPFCAAQTIKNWQTGDWQLDPEYPCPNSPPRLPDS